MYELVEDPNANKRRDVPADEICPHGPKCYRYLNFLITYKDRVRSERALDFGPERLREAYALPDRGADCFPTREFYPIGGPSNNNKSDNLAMTLGIRSWSASGGLHTHNQATFGRPGSFEGGSPYLRAPPLNTSASLPVVSPKPFCPARKAIRGDPQLAAMTRAHEKRLLREGRRTGDLAGAMRGFAQQLKRDARLPPEGNQW
mmetsp:Transcript_45095/g.125012  ORF Transcript_45095/g.125012 Transcript_45095/m.125012 type:complete len:203 (-) Transcript_45095:38-646(-)